MKSHIFIVGPHRAGSTLWHNLVAMCPNVMRLTEPRFLSPPRHRDFNFFLRSQARDLSSDRDIETMVELCFAKKPLPGLESTFWRFEGIKAADSADMKKAIVLRIKESDRSLGAIARILIDEITRFSGCDRAVVKFPVSLEYVPELVEWFPDCKVVHIARDPRGLAMSKSNDPSGTALRVVEHPRLGWFIRKAALLHVVREYRATARHHRRYQELKNYRLFRYEDLLAQPEKVLRELCAFIDVEFMPDMLSPEKGQHKHQPSSITGKRQEAFEPIAAIRWKTVISPLDNFIISALTRGSMGAMGYDPRTHPIFRMGPS
ncbi:MAG TPA: sulfotransferase [Vicinamibacterales bacterium]|nr:sulfotransferase [Vicinamibacterales bacterium]